MAGDSGPGLGQAILDHMPWISAVLLFLAGLWSALVGWVWRRNAQRMDNHGERIGKLERGKADREELRQLVEWQRQDTQIIHQKLDRLLGRQ